MPDTAHKYLAAQGIPTDISENAYLCANNNSIRFSTEISPDTAFAAIPSAIMEKMLAAHPDFLTLQEREATIHVKVGRATDTTGFGARHILSIEDHIGPIDAWYRQKMVHHNNNNIRHCQGLVAFLLETFSNLFDENNTRDWVIAFQPKYQRFVLAAETVKFRAYNHISIILFPDENNFIIGTAYPITVSLFKQIKKGSEKYLPICNKKEFSDGTNNNNNNDDSLISTHSVDTFRHNSYTKIEEDLQQMTAALQKVDLYEYTVSFDDLIASCNVSITDSYLAREFEPESKVMLPFIERAKKIIPRLKEALKAINEAENLLKLHDVEYQAVWEKIITLPEKILRRNENIDGAIEIKDLILALMKNKSSAIIEFNRCKKAYSDLRERTIKLFKQIQNSMNFNEFTHRLKNSLPNDFADVKANSADEYLKAVSEKTLLANKTNNVEIPQKEQDIAEDPTIFTHIKKIIDIINQTDSTIEFYLTNKQEKISIQQDNLNIQFLKMMNCLLLKTRLMSYSVTDLEKVGSIIAVFDKNKESFFDSCQQLKEIDLFVICGKSLQTYYMEVFQRQLQQIQAQKKKDNQMKAKDDSSNDSASNNPRLYKK